MNQYKIDMHVHTGRVSPCGKVSATEIVNLYKQSGYNGIVITDHFYDGYFDSLGCASWECKVDDFLSGYMEAFKEGNRIGLNVILGMELRFTGSANDYLVYGINEAFLKENPEFFNLSLTDFNKLIENNNIIIYQAHPFRAGLTTADPSLIDGVEVLNGNPRHNSNNHRAYEFALENNLRMISGSDFHQIQDLARGGIVVSENISSSEELAGLLKEGRIVELLGEKI